MKIKRIKLSKIIFIGFFSLSMIVLQPGLASNLPPNPSDYGGAFRTTAGNTLEYNVTKLNYDAGMLFSGNYTNPVTQQATLENGTIFNYNLTLGLLTTVQVTNENSSSFYGFNSQDTLTTSSFNVSTTPIDGSDYITFSFPNFESAFTYYNLSNTYFFKNSSTTIYSYQITQNFYTFAINDTSTGYIIFTRTTWNWKTGWEVSDYYRQTFGNGQLIYERQDDLIFTNFNMGISSTSSTSLTNTTLISSTIQTTNFSTSTPGMTLFPLILTINVVILYRKYKKKE